MRLFGEGGMGGVSVSDIAADADVFPSQVTYYFGSKEGLFVEVACREALNVGSAVESAGTSAGDLEQWVRAIVGAALDAPGLLMLVEAMLMARRRPDLAPMIEKAFERLHGEGERAVREALARHGWQVHTSPADEARAFWATVIGVALERAVVGESLSAGSAEAAVRVVLNLHHDRGSGT